jgi:N-acyl-D-amino-acid deacylase
MGEDASVRKEPTAAELAEMKHLVGEVMDHGAIGLGASYSLNHSGWGGVPMPSTISEIAEFDALVGAMAGQGRGVVEISSGPDHAGRDKGDRRPARPAYFYEHRGRAL